MRTIKRLMASVVPIDIQFLLTIVSSTNRQIASGMVEVAIFVLIGKAIGLVKEGIVANRFGISEAVDAYIFLLSLVDYLSGVWLSVISATLIPLIISACDHLRSDMYYFKRELLGTTIFLAVCLGIGLTFFLPWLVIQPRLNLTDRQISFARQMALPLAWVAGFGLVNGLFSTWIMAAKRRINTLFEAVPALMIACTVSLMGSASALAWSTWMGFALQMALLSLALARSHELPPPDFRFESPYWKPFLAGAGITLVGQMFISAGSIVDQFFAAQLGPGAIATLGYANRITSLILSIGSTSIGRSILPVLSEVSAQKSADLNRVVLQWSGLLFGAGLLVVGVGYICAPFAIKVVFEHGAFSAQDSEAVACIFRYALLQVPFNFASMVPVYALLSRQAFKPTAFIAFISFILKITVLHLLIPNFGIGGIPLANLFVYLSSFTMALFVIETKNWRASRWIK